MWLASYAHRGVTLMFAQMRGAVRDRLRRASLLDVIGQENIFPSIVAGVAAYQQRFPAEEAILASPSKATTSIGDVQSPGNEAAASEMAATCNLE
jgi:hypothetical protein